jgi:hypothetical protein
MINKTNYIVNITFNMNIYRNIDPVYILNKDSYWWLILSFIFSRLIWFTKIYCGQNMLNYYNNKIVYHHGFLPWYFVWLNKFMGLCCISKFRMGTLKLSLDVNFRNRMFLYNTINTCIHPCNEQYVYIHTYLFY